jgi:hypothetical protein
MGRKKQVEQGSGKGGKAGVPPAAVGLEPKRHSTPEERRAAVRPTAAARRSCSSRCRPKGAA